MIRGLLYTVVVTGLSLGPFASSRAQDVSDEAQHPAEIARARALFVEGNAAIQEGRWSVAADRFDASYELSGAPTALFNAAVARRALGQHRRARDAFERLLRDHGDLDPALRDRALQLQAESARLVASLILVSLPPPTIELTVDGARFADPGARPLELELDPGTHTVSVRREGYIPFLWEGELREGERAALEIRLERRAEEASLVESPWFWAIGGLALVASGVTAYLLLRDAGDPQPGYTMVIEL